MDENNVRQIFIQALQQSYAFSNSVVGLYRSCHASRIRRAPQSRTHVFKTVFLLANLNR